MDIFRHGSTFTIASMCVSHKILQKTSCMKTRALLQNLDTDPIYNIVYQKDFEITIIFQSSLLFIILNSLSFKLKNPRIKNEAVSDYLMEHTNIKTSIQKKFSWNWKVFPILQAELQIGFFWQKRPEIFPIFEPSVMKKSQLDIELFDLTSVTSCSRHGYMSQT